MQKGQAQTIAENQARAITHYADARLNASRLRTSLELVDTVLEKSRVNHSDTRMRLAGFNDTLGKKASIQDVAQTKTKLHLLTQNASQLNSRLAIAEEQNFIVSGHIRELESGFSSAKTESRENISRLDQAIQRLHDFDKNSSLTLAALDEVLRSQSLVISQNNVSSMRE